MLYIHEGGYLVDLPELSLYTIKNTQDKTYCHAPNYRKGLLTTRWFNDCYDTLLWMKKITRLYLYFLMVLWLAVTVQEDLAAVKNVDIDG